MEQQVPNASRMVIVDIGSHRRKRVKQLQKGEGKLVAEVDEVVAGLKAEGKVDANAQTVVVVVREKRRNPFRLF